MGLGNMSVNKIEKITSCTCGFFIIIWEKAKRGKKNKADRLNANKCYQQKKKSGDKNKRWPEKVREVGVLIEVVSLTEKLTFGQILETRLCIFPT